MYSIACLFVFVGYVYAQSSDDFLGYLTARLEARLAAGEASSGAEWRARLKAPYKYEAYLSPWQEPDEESETPENIPEPFRSTEPSQTRAERAAAGHAGYGSLRFSQDLAKAYVDVKIQSIDPNKINLFHIHCGLPGILGPILVDFSLMTNISENFLDDGLFSVEVTNEDIVAVVESGEGALAAFANGCVIPSLSLSMATDPKPVKVATVAGMAEIAQTRQLYFNLHTTSQTYFGDIRGQIWPTVE